MKDNRKKSQDIPGLVESIKNGMVVPIISDEAILGQILVGHKSLAEAYADKVGYTLHDRNNLPRIAKFYKLKRQKEAILEDSNYTNNDLRADFLYFIKEFLYDFAKTTGVKEATLNEAEAKANDVTVTEFAEILGYPNFDQGADNPLLVLANFDFKIYLTTSPFTFLEKALQEAGKEPRKTMIRWNQRLRGIVDLGDVDIAALDPSKPLVCHLFGLEDYPSSLVLTEDDYLDFLVDVNISRGDNSKDSVPAQVRQALRGDLLMLGFSLNSWTFRALHAGLIKSDDPRSERRGIAVQLPPSKAEESFFHDYLQREARIKPIWQDFAEYTTKTLPNL